MFAIATRLTFCPTLFYEICMERITTNRHWFDRIDGNVILGALPIKEMIKGLERENVKAVISMNKDYELLLSYDKNSWAQLGIDFLQLPTRDIFGTPSQEKLRKGVDFIKNYKGVGTVYVHCRAGRTRSATLVACYLMELNGWIPEEAIDHMKSCRPHIRLGQKEKSAISVYYDENLKGREKTRDE